MELINHYEEAGAGEPLILLHGNGESCEYFSRQISYFKENYRVIAVDTRGHGQKSAGNGAFYHTPVCRRPVRFYEKARDR